MDDTVCQGGIKVWLHDQDWYTDNYADAAAAFAFSKLGFPKPPPIYGGKLDVAFVIDTTGSMQPYIGAVKSFANVFAGQLASSGANFQIGLVDFKDAEVDAYGAQVDLPFTNNAASFQNAVNALSADGGGDTPEYALSGVQTAITGLAWRSGAKKTIILISDAPYKDPESLTGLTTASVSRAARNLDPAVVYPVLTDETIDASQYQPLADDSGGKLYVASDPTAVANSITEALRSTIIAPVATLTVSSPARPGDTVVFSASGSYDPAGEGLLSFSWDFDGDGVIDAVTSAETTTDVYAASFSGIATVTVRTASGMAEAGSPADLAFAPGFAARSRYERAMALVSMVPPSSRSRRKMWVFCSAPARCMIPITSCGA